MRVLVTADLHLGHAKLLLAEPARQRFKDVEEHDRYLEKRWRETVRPKDVVYVLGDVAWNRKGLERMRNWPGIKKLVMGNHDQLDMRAYLEVFKSVRAYSVIGEDPGWLLAHVPVHPSSLTRWSGQVHGHTHGKGAPFATAELETSVVRPYVSACVELHDFAPVVFEELITRNTVVEKQEVPF